MLIIPYSAEPESGFSEEGAGFRAGFSKRKVVMRFNRLVR
jgi:hypothetical protein